MRNSVALDYCLYQQRRGHEADSGGCKAPVPGLESNHGSAESKSTCRSRSGQPRTNVCFSEILLIILEAEGHPDERNKQFGRTRVSVRLDVQNSSFSNVRAGSVTCVFRRPAANDGAVLIEWRHGEELANTSVSVLSETASVGFLVRGLGQEVIDGAINGVFSVSLTLHICDLGRKPPPRPNSNHGAPLMLTPVLC